jgi:hypothetical protein
LVEVIKKFVTSGRKWAQPNDALAALPVMTFSTRNDTLSNSIGVASRFLICRNTLDQN